MSTTRTHNGKRWHCVEIVDEAEDVHSILSAYTDEDGANRLLRLADRRLPLSAHVYYWLAGERPVATPPSGYKGGPMTRPDGPRAH